MTSYVYVWETIQRGSEESAGQRPGNRDPGGGRLVRPGLGAVPVPCSRR